MSLYWVSLCWVSSCLVSWRSKNYINSNQFVSLLWLIIITEVPQFIVYIKKVKLFQIIYCTRSCLMKVYILYLKLKANECRCTTSVYTYQSYLSIFLLCFKLINNGAVSTDRLLIDWPQTDRPTNWPICTEMYDWPITDWPTKLIDRPTNWLTNHLTDLGEGRKA